ncbi:DNA-binding transcriptional regulator, MarR family [Microbacterium sp. cf046]|uniref:MarR family winged helix-turn-helix transcriptional regulator n=1 Tax=Microbacterium sp. cf046 TaxID=1761803 RepID=UPI0008DEFAFB|nr:MarR family winged helix-turn-helix transcriptional regulator [Microbacterium sp. cf046]SFR86717.1 DNA-binding transcriptional regulator, MarR family [Microbacterium sp. cf046]
MTAASSDPADAIAAALSRLRGRRMPRPPWEGGHGPGHAHHRGEPGWMRGDPRQGMGGPPWGAGPRLGGPARLRLLEALAAASGPLSVSEIGEAVGVDQPRASRLVQQAAEMGLVRREADPDDARRTRVALTETGSAIVRGFRGERRTAIDSALGSFTDQERAELARLLTKLADAWPQ